MRSFPYEQGYYRVSFHDIDQVIMDVFKKPYRVEEWACLGTDGQHAFLVQAREDPSQPLIWLEHDYEASPALSIILSVLVEWGEIPAGRYCFSA